MTSRLLNLFGIAGLLICGTSCATRTFILDGSRDIVRLGPGVKGRVYVWADGGWTMTGKTRLPEGWYAGPGPTLEDK